MQSTAVSVGPDGALRPSRGHRERLFTVAWIVALVCLVAFLGSHLLVAMYQSTHFNGHAMNGAFQIYNPLRRMAAGEIPGRDFQFFHGVGVPWLHYPGFILLGGGLFGSELTRIFLSPLLFFASTAVFFLAFFKEWRRAVIATAVFVSLAPFLTETVEHGNALLGVRSTVPVLIAACLFWTPRRRWSLRGLDLDPQRILITVLLGLSFSMGTEQGIAAIGAYFLLRLIVVWRRRPGVIRVILQVAVEGVAVVVSTLLWVIVFTGGHVAEALRYALIEAPQDQSWYFGVHPNPYLTWNSFLQLMFQGLPLVMIIVGLVTATAVVLAHRRGNLTPSERQAFLFMAVAGVLACVSFFGYFWPQNQMSPLGRMIGLVLTAVSIRWILQRAGKQGKLMGLAAVNAPAKAVLASVVIATMVAATVGAFFTVRQFSIRDTLARTLSAPALTDVEVSTGTWPGIVTQFEPYLDGHTFWSTWGSMHEANARVLHPSNAGADYIIHALGEERRAEYEAQFVADRPDYVITVNPAFSGFEGWLWAPHSVFYEHLLTNYDLIVQSTPHYLWERRDAPVKQDEPWLDANLDSDGSFTVEGNDSDETEVIEVTVDYNASANLPLLDKIPRYFLNASDSGLLIPISLPSYETEFTFFVPLIAGQEASVIVPSTDGIIPTASLEIIAAKYRVLTVPSGNEELFEAYYCPNAIYIENTSAKCG